MQISVRVKPGSKVGPLIKIEDDQTLTVYVHERAVDGKANEAVVKLLAKHFGIAKSRVELIRGATSKVKCFEIDIN